jgi:hypothetical protein
MSKRCSFRGSQLTTKLEIARESTSLRDGVGAIEGKVHVGLRVSRDESGSKHLRKLLDCERWEAG